ncbi:bifunctional riboflavin kinase/FAD synthetase [Caldicellulosiruptor morganii]|uniref:Riboflavin biosynthesis protein n=1 Tax=Caldicellulosiruptor morganii TaxID=1387555 RepID=A0ABY7BRY7_9FIRM|nr:bifunctional riboflavin kinase/FAD synthetase [Caldicellulosiruptor morganii]WAM34787.1 bifunctional riboflavin kinase/FAD synthetase [Caldicellulosiruptor morganii]
MNIYNRIRKRNDIPVVALGFFDGFHLGHKKIFEVLALNAGQQKKVAFTFKNHPDRLLGLDVKYILTNSERLEFFEKYGIEDVYFIEFTDEFMQMDKDRFIREILIEKLNAGLVVVGYDFTFGYKAEGNSEYLCRRLKDYGRQCIVIDPVTYNHQVVSSTLIRNLIMDGNIQLANSMLGYNFFINGIVKKGNRIGRKLGFPTLNIRFDKDKIIPKRGVYVTNTIIDSRRYISITNVGVNPTVSKTNSIKIETHVLDFEEKVYGKKIKLEFIDFIRDEKKFESLQDLKNQIEKDIAYVKDMLCRATVYRH